MPLHNPRKSWARWALFGAAGTLIAVVGVAAFVGMAHGVIPGDSQTKSLACSPQPCLDLQDYTLWVSNVAVAGDIVRVTITFRNSSPATHADPSDLELIDANKRSWPTVQDGAGCTQWSRTEFSNGAKLGPLTICFRPASTASPLILRWGPDLGLICCGADLKIR